MNFYISEKPLKIADLKKSMTFPRAGACVSFEGWVRNHNEGKSVEFLEYEAYEVLCQKEAENILDETKKRYQVVDVKCVHRVGSLNIGDVAIWIGATAVHREEAFRACQYVIDEVKLRLPVWKKEHYSTGEAEWVNCQECYKHSHHYHCDSEELQFYSRQANLLDKNSQRVLKASKAVVVGAGGLGCPALRVLAGAGVGSVSIIDGDNLEISNLHRQNLYSFHDVGKNKARLAEEVIRKYNPFIRVQPLDERVSLNNVEEILEGAGIVLDCTDNFKTTYLLHDYCRYHKIPLVQASLYKNEGEIEFFSNERKTPCLRCYAPKIPSETCTGKCEDVGVFAYTTEVIGSLQAKIAIDFLVGKEVNVGKVVVHLDEFRIQKFRVKRNKECPFCSGEVYKLNRNEFIDPEWDIDYPSDRPAHFTWVDIREPGERLPLSQAMNLSKNIPLSEKTKIFSLDKHKSYIFFCQKGMRSTFLVRELRERGFARAYSLKGGVEGVSRPN